MGNKIGRNELCPCGSGLKFKKCCINVAKSNRYQALTKYIRLDLVSFLASLLLLPINQSKQIRIEKAIWNLLNDYQSGHDTLVHDIAIKDVNTCIKFCDEEDPVENLFTQNVMFYGGNYTVYPGISSDSVNQLQIILDSIISMKDDVDPRIVRDLFTTSICMLKLSNSVAQEICHKRYMNCVQDHRNPLVGFENQATCNDYIGAISFSEERLHETGIVNWSIFNPFIFSNEDLTAREYQSKDNMFCSKPLYKSQDSLIVLFPSLIADALKRYLLATLDKHNLYKGLVLKSIMRQASTMHKEFCDKGYQHVTDVVEVDGDANANINADADIYTASIYRIDIDKYLAHVILSSYGGYGAVESCNRIFQNSSATLERVYRDVENSVKEINNEAILDNILFLISGMYFGCELYPYGTDPIVVNLADLFLILRSDHLNQLSFWKFSKALKTLPHINPGLSFFSLWHIYNDNNQTFYISDGERPSFMYFDYSIGIESKCDMYSSNDIHLALDTNNMLTKVIKHTTLYQNCIYNELAIGSSRHFLLVDDYKVPIWVTLDDSKELLVFKTIVAEGIGYWLWKMSSMLNHHVSPCGLREIDISLSSSRKHEDKSADKQNPAVVSIEGMHVYVTEKGINIDLNSESQYSFIRSDNEAEYVLMKEIVGYLLRLSNLDPAFADTICTQCMNDDKAKMIHINEKNDVFSILTDCSWIHQLHNTDIDLLLDDVAKEISSSVDKKIDYEITHDKLCAINRVIDHYLSMLSKRIEGSDVKRLIEALMRSHEALIYIKHKKTWLSSSIRHCYPEVFPKHQNDIIDIDNSMRAIRFLIEFSMHKSSAECILSNDSIEELLAICHHIISFGIKKDILRSNLWEIKIDKLASGRLGIVEESASYNRFVKAKQESLFEYYERSYIDEYSDQSSNNIAQIPGFDKALIAEYGINGIDIEDILYRLEEISRSDSSSVVCMKRELLKTELLKSGIACDKVDAFLNMFVLEQRDSWESLPSGLAHKVIEPWQQKRKLSLAFKPIIPQQDDLIIGVKTLFQSYFYLISGIHNGRLKEDFFKSSEMKAYSERIIKQLSCDFVDLVQNRINELNPDMIAGTDLEINKNGDIDITSDLGLGDIDILAYDSNRKLVHSIECKRINFGRTPTEIRNERERFIRDSHNQSSWISKHRRRHQWMNSNKEAIRVFLKLTDTNFSIQSYVVVSEDIALKYLESSDISILTLDELITMLES